MIRAADWRSVAVLGGAAGLALAALWNPGGEWLRPLIGFGLVVLVAVERDQCRWPGLVLIALAAAVTGLLIGGARLEAIDGGALERAPGKFTLSGHAIEPPSESRGISRFALNSNHGRVLVETSAQKANEVSPGAGIEATGSLEVAADWQRSDLRRRGIAMVLKAHRIQLTGRQRGGLSGLVDRLRNRALRALEASVPDREAALSKGFVLGDDSEIDLRTTEDFRRSGLAHLLAVSGQNVILLALLAMPFLAAFGVAPRLRLLVIAMLILIYVPLAGGGPSIQRAGVMGIAGLVAIAATRGPSRIYALGLALLFTLGLNPRASADIGWQLSFAAVIGIMLLVRPIQRRLGPLIGVEGWRKSLVDGTAVTVAATLTTAPLIAFHFESLPLTTVIANLLAMPAVAPAMWLGMISIAAGQIGTTLAVPFNLAGSLSLAWIAQVAEWCGRPEWAVMEVSIGSPLVLALVSGILATLIWIGLRLWPTSLGTNQRRLRLAFGGFVILAVALVLFGLKPGERRDLDAPPAGGVRIEVLDVGQGDASLIRPSGADPILIDGGPPGGDLVGALASARVDRLEAIMLTHADLDHYGGLLDILGLVDVERLIVDQLPSQLLDLAEEHEVEIKRVSADQRIKIGGLFLEILSPDRITDSQDRLVSEEGDNDRSIVAVLHWKGFRMLFTGDAESESVPIDPGPVDVLKVAHHGSEDLGLPWLLDRTRPRLGIISLGRENRYGHPVPQVLSALEVEQVELTRTDRDGTVSIVLEDTGEFTLETGR